LNGALDVVGRELFARGAFAQCRKLRIGGEPERGQLLHRERRHGALLIRCHQLHGSNPHLRADDAVLQPRRVSAAHPDQHEDGTEQSARPERQRSRRTVRPREHELDRCDDEQRERDDGHRRPVRVTLE
jgi:hypothetical protein